MSVQLRTIKGYNSFSKIYQNGMKFRFMNMSAVVCFEEIESDCDGFIDKTKCIIYYGVTIGKKTAKKAVVRNRIKRLMRESLRITVKELEIRKLLPIQKIIFSYFYAPKHLMQINLNDVLPAVKNLLEYAYLGYENINKKSNW